MSISKRLVGTPTSGERVVKGTYQMGVVSADAMYDGNYHSYYGARSVVIR